MSNQIEAAIQTMVADAVQAALAPYGDILTRFQSLMAPVAAKRGPGRPPKAAGFAAAPVKVKAKRGRKAKKAKAVVNTFKVGDVVAYKQGRGTFQATVIELDEVTGLLVLERASDGKRILRKPAAIEATGAAPAVETKAEEKPSKRPAKKAKGGRKAKKAKAQRTAKPARAARAAKAKVEEKAEAGAAVRINLTEGQTVVYRQGKGAFKAKVTGIDEAHGTVTLARATDGKKVIRPAAKVQATEE